MQIAGHLRYPSRIMRQVINDLSTRAISAYLATGADPEAVLPEEGWFIETAKDGLRKLRSGWTKGSNINGEPGSPTHSISAQSVSSVRSE